MTNQKLKQVVRTFTLWIGIRPVTHTADLLTLVVSIGPTPILSLHCTTHTCGAEGRALAKPQFLSATYSYQGSELKISFSQKEGVCDMNALLNSTYWKKKTRNDVLITGKEISFSLKQLSTCIYG